MHPELGPLRNALQALAGSRSPGLQASAAYTGSPNPLLGVAIPHLRRLARHWLAANRTVPPEAILTVADGLLAGALHDEKTLGAIIVGYSRAARAAATPARVDGWLGGLVGWAEVDALCANAFEAQDLLADWSSWGAWLRRLARDPNINKRRASLVLLTGPVRSSDDPRLVEAALANIANLQAERSILITKAVSWLLRSLVARHRDAVVRYLAAHRAALPALAAREVSAKLETGRKTRRDPARPRQGFS